MSKQGHAGAIFDLIAGSKAPPAEIAKLNAELVYWSVADLRKFYHPHAPVCSEKGFQTTVKDWAKAVEKIENPAEKADVVIGALRRWNEVFAYNHEVIEAIKREPRIGQVIVKGYHEGTPMREVLEIQSERINHALTVAKPIYLSLMRDHPAEISAALNSISAADFKNIQKHVGSLDLTDYSQKSVGRVVKSDPVADSGFGDLEPA